jgi:hypothetical protein
VVCPRLARRYYFAKDTPHKLRNGEDQPCSSNHAATASNDHMPALQVGWEAQETRKLLLMVVVELGCIKNGGAAGTM